MTVNCIDSAMIKSISGKCYAGQTYDDAKAEGGSIFREFKRLNKDNDSVLSSDEIMKNRNKRAAVWKTISTIFIAIALYRCACGILANSSKAIMEGCMKQLDTTAGGVCFTLFTNALIHGGVGLFAKHKANKINNESANMIRLNNKIDAA